MKFLADFMLPTTKFQNGFITIIPRYFRIVIGKVTSEALDLFHCLSFPTRVHRFAMLLYRKRRARVKHGLIVRSVPMTFQNLIKK